MGENQELVPKMGERKGGRALFAEEHIGKRRRRIREKIVKI